MTSEITATNDENAKEPDETAKSTVSIEYPVVPIEYITYNCFKSEEISWKGKRYYYYIDYDTKRFYTSKLKAANQAEPIPVSQGLKCHYRDQNEYFVLTSKNLKAYSIRKGSPTGRESGILTLFQMTYTGEPKGIRYTIYHDDNSMPLRLVSLKPNRLPDNSYQLDFRGRYCVPSIKNCILIRETDKREMIAVRKVEQNELEIDALASIPPIYIHVLNLALWCSAI